MATTFEKTENHVAQSLRQAPDSTKAFNNELHSMQHCETPKAFHQDLAKMNDDLHKQGLLPGLQIVDSGPDRDFGLKKMDRAKSEASPERVASINSNDRIEPHGLPGRGGNDRQSIVENSQRTLADPKATAADKLSTVENLSKNGIKNIQVADKDGKMRDYSIETQKSGDHETVHLYGRDDNGKNQIALRGVDNGNGTFSQEKDRNGRNVDFQGSRWADSQGGKSNVGLMSDVQNTAPIDSGKAPARSDSDLTRSPDADKAPKKPAEAGDTPKPEKAADAGDGQKPERSPGSIDRSQFDDELKNPTVRDAFARRMTAEVGSQGPAAQTAFAEEVMNRAAARGQKLMQALSGKYYKHHNPEKLPEADPRCLKVIDDAWHNGTDTIHGATGNSSKHVGFGVKGGHYDANRNWVSPNQTANIGGERFGYEQQDVAKGWLDQYAKLKQQA
ncbi:MAG: hypothetical protein P4L53_01240 [Candidatus Obscuribacterales bacterium]|nr:hypothetical protein [Candidatus Obscuribacterales bacterium]